MVNLYCQILILKYIIRHFDVGTVKKSYKDWQVSNSEQLEKEDTNLPA